MIKKLFFALYTLIVACIGITTIIEKYHGTSFVSENIYGAWWFSALWAVLTVVACAYILKQQLYKRAAVMLLHMSFVVILAGALTTHLFAQRGTIRLRTNITETSYADKDGKVEPLPFSLTLKEFRVVNYPGTDAPLDYQSVLGFKDSWTSQAAEPSVGTQDGEVTVSMNNIGYVEGYRLFQQSYDSDGEGVTLGVSYDPYGICITYLGYLLLLLGIIATLLSRKTQMRALYRKAFTTVLLLVSVGANAQNSLISVDKEIAHRMGTINVLYNDRICPLNTVATDFAIKMTGNASWNGYSADEIFFSWMIYYTPWEKELLLNNTQKKGASDRNAVVEMFYNGQFTKLFPYCIGDTVNWYSPGGQVLPREIPVKEQFFIKQSMDFLTESIVTGQRDRAFEIIAKIKLFQREQLGDLLPSETATKAEILYNTLRSQKWPVFLSLTLSLLLCIVVLMGRKSAFLRYTLLGLNIILFTYVTMLLGMRWWLGEHIPVSNGHETMLFMAWVMLLLTFLLYRKASIVRCFGPLMASFCLLVATLAGSSSQLTPLMPVLQSPLLSIHVMTVMCAYALFALQMLLGIYAMTLRKGLHSTERQLEKTTALSQFLLYPAVFLLAIGIFLGAVWANVSWGNYWSWDPKETWALITLMVYAVPFHRVSIGAFRSPRVYHIYIICAFLAVLITYFGVNYLLGGAHSYA